MQLIIHPHPSSGSALPVWDLLDQKGRGSYAPWKMDEYRDVATEWQLESDL